MTIDKCKLLESTKYIAIVGLSRNPFRTSRIIANYLVHNGFNVVGVNPNESFSDANGIKVYNRLTEIPHKIDIVNVFRRSEDIPAIVDDVIKVNPKALWLQLGIINDIAAESVIKQGILFVQDSCIKIDHSFCK